MKREGLRRHLRMHGCVRRRQGNFGRTAAPATPELFPAVPEAEVGFSQPIDAQGTSRERSVVRWLALLRPDIPRNAPGNCRFAL
jgi:hypothetical protein